MINHPPKKICVFLPLSLSLSLSLSLRLSVSRHAPCELHMEKREKFLDEFICFIFFARTWKRTQTVATYGGLGFKTLSLHVVFINNHGLATRV